MRVPLGKDDLAEGSLRGVDIAGNRRVLLARVAGKLHALDDWCNHSGCQLSEGRLTGPLVRCPCHGMEFDVRTGLLATTPRLCDDQRVVPVVEEGGELYALVDGWPAQGR